MQLGTTAIIIALFVLKISAKLTKRVSPPAASQTTSPSPAQLYFDTCVVRIKERGRHNEYWSHIRGLTTPGGIAIIKHDTHNFEVKTSEDCRYYKVLKFDISNDRPMLKNTWEVEISPTLQRPSNPHKKLLPPSPTAIHTTSFDANSDFDACQVRIKHKGMIRPYKPFFGNPYWSDAINFAVPGDDAVINYLPQYHFVVKTSDDCSSFKVLKHYDKWGRRWAIEIKPIRAFNTFPRIKAPTPAR